MHGVESPSKTGNSVKITIRPDDELNTEYEAPDIRQIEGKKFPKN